MTFRPDFEVTIETAAGARTRAIKVRGELDSGTCDAVLAAFHEAVAAGTLDELTLDLKEVSFIDSAGTRAMVLIEQSARENGIHLVVMQPPDEVTELLRVAGVVDRITMSPGPSIAHHDAEFAERVELELPCDPHSPSRARAEVRELMAGRLEQDEVANLVLLTSELVTNAVIHPRTAGAKPIGLRITTYEGSVRVEVEDAGEGFDPTTPIPSQHEGGRGLFLVDSVAAKWGTRRAQTDRGERFRVWFELDWPERAAIAARSE